MKGYEEASDRRRTGMRSLACGIVAATLLSVFAVPVSSQVPPADTATVQEIQREHATFAIANFVYTW
jgi:hypothetical protein